MKKLGDVCHDENCDKLPSKKCYHCRRKFCVDHLINTFGKTLDLSSGKYKGKN
jgi:hypothetical protein